MYDARSHRALGEPSELPTLNIFIERTDGTTPEFFSKHWYIHGGHPDGEELEGAEARAYRKRREEDRGRLYIQNRVIEPVTATPWVAHGIGVLTLPAFPSAAFVEADDHPRAPGEAQFDRWPPRIMQGYRHRVR